MMLVVDTPPAATILHTALDLVRKHGAAAGAVAHERRDGDAPANATWWTTVVAVVAVLQRADRLMQDALALLDAVGECGAPPHLDRAIDELGLRPAAAAAQQVGLAPAAAERRYQSHAARHRLAAAAAHTADDRALHRDLAAAYARLHEEAGAAPPPAAD